MSSYLVRQITAKLIATLLLIVGPLMGDLEAKNMSTETAVSNVSEHKFNDVSVTLSLSETKAKEGKSVTQYWAIDFDALAVIATVKETKTVKEMVNGKEVEKQVETERRVVDESASLNLIAKLYGGYARLVNDIIAPKANANIKAAQLEAGKDVYSVSQKLDYAKAYIDADFGATSRGGAGIAQAFKDLKQQNATMADLTKRIFEYAMLLANPATSAADKVEALAKMQSLQSEAAKLQPTK